MEQACKLGIHTENNKTKQKQLIAWEKIFANTMT